MQDEGRVGRKFLHAKFRGKPGFFWNGLEGTDENRTPFGDSASNSNARKTKTPPKRGFVQCKVFRAWGPFRSNWRYWLGIQSS